MKTKRKALALALCAVLLVVTSVLGTMAYLTDTDKAINTFTVGQVHIKLDEADVNTDGTVIEGADRVKTNEYHLLPGHTYFKDPTVTVLGGSEDSYVRMIMTVHNASAVQAIIDADDTGNSKGEVVDYADLFAGWDNQVWLYEGFEVDAVANTIEFEFRYKGIVEGPAADKALEPLFTKLVVPGHTTNAHLEALYGNAQGTTAEDGVFKIEIVAHAIQADGFDDAEAAWTAWVD